MPIKLVRVLRIAILCSILAFALGTIPSKQGCKAGCGPNDSYCTSNCCLGTTVLDYVTSCTYHSNGWCSNNYTREGVTCPSPGCQAIVDPGTCVYYPGYCVWEDSYGTTGCCASGPAPTSVPPVPTNTPKPTDTPKPTPTFTPTPSPLTASLTPKYVSLVYMAPK